VWAPAILISGLLLVSPSRPRTGGRTTSFRRRDLVGDARFWALFAGMLFGTLPYLVVMGSVKPLGTAFGLGAAAAAAVPVLAAGNACGRIAWGWGVDRLGPRQSMLAAQTGMLLAVLALMAAGRVHVLAFLGAGFGIGFCYGSNFAIYPATVARQYGAHVLGSVYPFVMAAQALSSLGPTANGMLVDRFSSYLPGLGLAAGLSVVALAVTVCLWRALGVVAPPARAG